MTTPTTTIQIGPWVFDHVVYDEEADVAYLTIGPPRRAHGVESPNGHIAMFDEETGEFCGLTIIGLQDLLEQANADGIVNISVPVPQRSEDVGVPKEDLSQLVCA